MKKQLFFSPFSRFIHQSITPFIKKQKKYVGLLFVLFTLGFLSFFLLVKNINIGYFDFGEGSSLYTAWRLKHGVFPYIDIISPYPPVLYIYGALLFFISESVLFVRWINFFFYVAGIVLLYLIVFKVYRSQLAAFIVSIGSLFLPISSSWWLSFSTETLQRFLILLTIFMLIPVRRVTLRRAVLIGLCCVVLFFLKYTALPFILMTGLVLFVGNRKMSVWFAISFVLSVIAIAVLLMVGTKGAFLYQTLLLRSLIPLREAEDIVRLGSNFAINILPFCILNVLCAVFYLRRKDHDAWFLLLLPVLYTINTTSLLFVGTYPYIYFPVEPLYLLGFGLLIAGIVLGRRSVFEMKGKLKLFTFFMLFIASLVCINYLQSIESAVELTNTRTEHITKEAVRLIQSETKQNDPLTGSAYFAFLSKRKMAYDLPDMFLAKTIMKYDKKETKTHMVIQQIEKDMQKKKIKVVVVDALALSMKELTSPLKKNYILRFSREYFPLDVVMVYAVKETD